MARMNYRPYREMTENDELKRRISRLEEKMDKLQSDNEEMRKILKSRFGVLKLKVLEDNNESQQRRGEPSLRFGSPGIYARETDYSSMPLKKSKFPSRKVKKSELKVLKKLLSEQRSGKQFK